MANQHFQSGELRYKSRDFEGAILAFTRAIEIEPTNADIYYQRGISYFHLNRKSLALIDFNQAQELQPNNPFRYSSRAYIKDACGDISGAISDYERAIELDPEDAVSHNNLGLLQEKLGYMKKAKKSFDLADELADKNEFFNIPKTKEADLKEEEESLESISKESAKKNQSLFQVVKQVFTDKNTFREFLTFVRNGLK
jgi:tetratricopeptide (TPR) repeat protein